MPKEQYMCQLCANHGVFNQPKKGHKQKCPHRNCICSLCALNTKRRALDQIERQLRNASNEVRGDTVASTNSDAVGSSYPYHKVHVSAELQECLSDVNTTDRTFSSESNADHSTSPMSVKLPPTLSPQSYSSQESSSSSSSYSVTLPATISRREVRGLLRDDFRGSGNYGYAQSLANWTTSTSSQRDPSRTLKDTLTNIQRNRSIFHSAEQLAGIS
ncbi:hypothetical protein V3C99_014735 [Haemonchus contortus]